MNNQKLKDEFDAFCMKTTAHGFSYLGAPSKTVRICWFIILTFAFVVGSLHLYTLISEYLQYDYHDAVVTNTEITPMFPDVTICDNSGIAESSLAK